MVGAICVVSTVSDDFVWCSTEAPETTRGTLRSCGSAPPCSAILPVPPV